MYYFCTYFDEHYLPRGLGLFQSLRQHCAQFRMWVLCLDDVSYTTLAQLGHPELILIPLAQLEQALPELLSAKQNRSLIEYYFTCTPALPWYILQQYTDVDLLMYVDADMFFFGDPAPVIAEMSRHSITIIPHRYPEYLRDMEEYGIYNVGMLAFRRDTAGLACVHLWFEQCIAWCYDRLEGERYADQKYLEQWPALFPDVLILPHKGVNTAPWNIMNYRFSQHDGQVFVDDEPLILFHFHGFKQRHQWLYDTHTARYATYPSLVLQRWVYRPYIQALVAARAATALSAGVRFAEEPPEKRTLLGRLRLLLHYAWGIARGRYLLYWNQHLFMLLMLRMAGFPSSSLVCVEWLNGLAPLAYLGGLF